MTTPAIIQGGMGVAVSNWRLARAVSQEAQLGVVSASLLAVVQARLLQQGDPGGHLRRAFAHFPLPGIVKQVLADYFVPGGIPKDQPFRPVPMPSVQRNPRLEGLTVLSNFAEVFLAKEGHRGQVGINLLEKIKLPTLPSLYGAMLAGVDVVLMGAGVPREIPGALDQLAAGEAAELKLHVEDRPVDQPPVITRFDPQALWERVAPKLPRPRFFAIISSATLALTLARKSTGVVDGFVVEAPNAGGHNAPPRASHTLSESGEPIYGPRDAVDFPRIRSLGLPFWLAGGASRPGKLAEARAIGAAGVQVGTAFALCDESGIVPELKRRVREWICAGLAHVRTDPLASPTGFPFKMAQLSQTLSDAAAYARRLRRCDLGYLRSLFQREDGTVGYRCPAEAPEAFVRKGGDIAETTGRQCLCNGLAATVGLGQVLPDGSSELPILTAGDELRELGRFFDLSRESFTVRDVLNVLLGNAPALT
ncbi:nitronate monooxygenase [Actomonas aquatica]|uniref:Nitronate monooxygenase n=1 Tax=Actomonas aquatica TaxID=2866162 RepID=A0ABZ1CA32_9BACT|nr:nitronate monooxygenase [Opitutus sp. WL0086]WRQ88336.1 nitronate monooxygenase [Opitutus sp. WL0086]